MCICMYTYIMFCPLSTPSISIYGAVMLLIFQMTWPTCSKTSWSTWTYRLLRHPR